MATTPQTQLAREVAEATADVLRQVTDKLAGRVYSPRIKLLSVAQVTEATGMAESTIYKLVKAGKFPKPKQIGRRNVWRESTIIAFLDDLPDNDCVGEG